MENVFRSQRERKFSYIVFVFYLLLLCWLVLFKFATSMEAIPHIRGINLIPFHYDMENSVHLKEVIYNIIVFIPCGVYLSAFLSKKSIGLGILITFILSMVLEVLQWIFAIGASDITDVIGNTLGGVIGLSTFLLMGKIAPKCRMKIVNGIGLVVEVLAIVLLGILYVANR